MWLAGKTRIFAKSLRTILASWALAAILPHLTTAAEVAFVLKIEHGRVPESMRLIRVKQNDIVRLQWTTDQAWSIHLHGYDIEKNLKPGEVTEMIFTARATGRFTIEPHVGTTPTGGHAHGDVLVTIEVYP
jgi:hypothetical protein